MLCAQYCTTILSALLLPCRKLMIKRAHLASGGILCFFTVRRPLRLTKTHQATEDTGILKDQQCLIQTPATLWGTMASSSERFCQNFELLDQRMHAFMKGRYFQGCPSESCGQLSASWTPPPPDFPSWQMHSETKCCYQISGHKRGQSICQNQI